MRQPGPRRPSRTTLVEDPTELGEAAGLSDHEPAQLQQPGLHHPRELTAREVGQVSREVARVLEAQDFGVVGVADLVDRGDDDFKEQPLLDREVLVDGLLRHPGDRGDLVHGRAEVAVAKERRRRGLEDCLALAGRPREVIEVLLSGSPTVTGLIPPMCSHWYWTV